VPIIPPGEKPLAPLEDLIQGEQALFKLGVTRRDIKHDRLAKVRTDLAVCWNADDGGVEVCRALKQNEKTRRIPVIMLTVKNTEADKVLGLEMGADDYITKPFSPRELLARIKAILRRTHPKAPEDFFKFHGLEIDWSRYQVSVQGKAVELTPKEFELLRALIEAKGKVLSRDRLLDLVWGFDSSGDLETRTVDLHVSQLRKKLKKAGDLILTVKSAGYRVDLNA
ncbi:MAG: winged helix-turn-helix domain-containing protein, partial [bacterium]|nr:winged helix-turn-helix domain-containing protein [bacterium]